MEEEIKMFLDEAKALMQKSIEHTNSEFGKIRAGKATPGMLDGLFVNYYGSQTPISNVATINTPDARTLTIKPFERTLIGEIEKTIKNSDLGINPQNNGEQIILTVPPLTEERRKNLVKQVKQEAESGKVSIRNVRKDINESLKKLQKDGAAEDAIKGAEDEVQKYTNTFIAKVDELANHKEVELLKV